MPGFVGVVFDAPVSSFTITDTDTSGNGVFDNFRVVSGPNAVEPLPAALPLKADQWPESAL
ncbi:MAG: hypothetical protein AAGB05_13760 [Pseudomonadota bacterium]